MEESDGRTRARIVLAEDDILLRAGLASLLERSGFEIVAQAGDGEELIAAVRDHQPDVAIVDIRMPPAYETEGLDAAQVIRPEFPRSASSCCPLTSRSTRPPSCSPPASASATC